VLVAL